MNSDEHIDCLLDPRNLYIYIIISNTFIKWQIVRNSLQYLNWIDDHISKSATVHQSTDNRHGQIHYGDSWEEYQLDTQNCLVFFFFSPVKAPVTDFSNLWGCTISCWIVGKAPCPPYANITVPNVCMILRDILLFKFQQKYVTCRSPVRAFWSKVDRTSSLGMHHKWAG